MTTVKKLSIQGVRSYSDKEPEVIEFFHPLTIIVGANGSGKTTIIEALKFACTGGLPSLCDKGMGFVHDPKMVGQAQVKAQVKLAFRTSEDKPVLCIRNFMVQQKAGGKLSFKSVESVLRTVNDHNQQVSISHRCTDMDKQVPQLMGVSKAVLENVIFCHQEDSNWPLSEPKYLKQKFDDIFAATRFTKALEVIKKLRSEQLKDLKMMEADLKILEHNMDMAHKLEDDLDSTKERIKNKSIKINKLSDEMKEVEKQLGNLNERAKDVLKIKNTIKRMKQEKDMMIKEKELAYSRIDKEYEEDDETLTTLYKEFASRMDDMRERLQAQQDKLGRAKARLGPLQTRHQEMLQALGRQEALKLEQDKRKGIAQKMAAQLGNKHSIDNSDRINPSQLLTQLKQVMQHKNTVLKTQREDAQRQDSDFERSIRSLAKKEAHVLEQITVNEQTAKSNVGRLRGLAEKAQKLTNKMSGLSNIKDSITRAQEDISDMESNDNVKKLQASIESLNRKIKNNQNRLSGLAVEKRKLAHQSKTLMEVKFKREATEKARDQHNTALSALLDGLQRARIDVDDGCHSLPDDIRSLTSLLSGDMRNSDIDSRVLEKELKLKSEKQAKMFAKAKDDSNKIKGELSAIQGELGAVVRARELAEGKLEDLNSQLKSGMTDFREKNGEGPRKAEDIASFIKKKHETIESSKGEKYLTRSATIVYTKFVHLAQQNKQCPLCSRGFDDKQLKKFVQDNSEKMSKVQSDQLYESIKARIKADEMRIKRLRELETLSNTAKRVEEEELNKYLDKESDLKQKSEIAQKHVDSLQRRVNVLSEQEQRMNHSLTEACNLSRMFNQVRDKAIILIEAEQTIEDAQGGNKLEDVERDMANLEDENRENNKVLTTKNNELQKMREDKHVLQAKLQSLREQAMELKNMEHERARLKQSRNEIQTMNKELSEELRRLNDQVVPLKQQIKEITHERANTRRTNEQGEETLRNDAQQLERQLAQFQKVCVDIKDFDDSMEERGEVKDNEEKARGELKSLRGLIERLTNAISDLSNRVAEENDVDRDIQANLEYRSRAKAIVKQAHKIEEQMRVYDDMTQGQDVHDEISGFQADLQKLNTARAELRGALLAEEHQANQYMDDLSTERYRDIDRRKREKEIEVKTTNMANKDLARYSKALDEALMRFHSIKMKEINDILREYWRSTYRGKDIDEVYIRSKKLDDTGGKAKYDYRVVMKQGDTELDMRGRCSAGQKVLASLLIRLALSETFCLQCGMLALDEPTTNLDEANIAAFAKALSNIIRKRRGQRNFQLILITHDDAFVEKIGQRANADYYYRVYKDLDQKSKIRKQAL